MTDRTPAEVFPPGEILKEELEARGWAQNDLSEILGCSPRLVNEVVAGKRSITPETAYGLGEALGTGGQFWLNLESAFQLYRLAGRANDQGVVAKRAKLFEKAPVREMVRRGWIEGTDDAEALEQRVLRFFEIRTLDDEPKVWPHAARKSTADKSVSPAQWAWLVRARQLARAVGARRFTDARFSAGLEALKDCLISEQEIRRVPGFLAEAGVRLVVIEPLKGTKIDGACFWLNRHSPVVAVSARYDRIDWFWHTLLHELGHVTNRDGLNDESCPLDIDLVGSRATASADKPDFEQAADEFAVRFLVDQVELGNFIARVRPLFSTGRLIGFAKRIGAHPGIVVGQLQFRGEISYAHSRTMLVKIRDILCQSALTDGWGSGLPSGI